MKLKLAFVPIALATIFAGYAAFHPGVAYAEPRMAEGTPSSFAEPAEPADYTVDPDHTNLYFDIGHLGLSRVHGRIGKFTGKIHEDEKDLSRSSVEFTAQMESIDTAVAARDAHLRTAEFFDVAKYPTLSFKSTKIAKGKGGYVATGDLTIKGVTKTISIPFKHYGPYTMKGMGDQPTRVGIIAAPIVLKRSDFGVGSTAPMPDGNVGVSDDVNVEISLEAIIVKP
ncbi:YceI family protein [soil metagenome]